MDEVVIKIMVELLSALALATKKLKQGQASESVLAHCYLTECNAVKFMKTAFGEKDVEAILQRLERLTHDEARNTAAQTLEVVYGLVHNLKMVMEGEQTQLACNLPSVEYLST
jgi:hypothetical protein